MTRSKQQVSTEKTQEQYIAELEAYAAKLKEMVEAPKPERKIPWGDIAPWAVMLCVAAFLFIRHIRTDPDPTPQPIPTSWQKVQEYYPTIVGRHKDSYRKAAQGVRSGEIKTGKALFEVLVPALKENRKDVDADLDKFFDNGLPRNDDDTFSGDKDLKEPAAKFLETLAENL